MTFAGGTRKTPLAEALALHQAGQLDQAARLYLRILQRTPRDFNALHFLGILRFAQGNASEAVRLIGQALAVDGRFPDAHLNLGNALAAVGRFDDAVEKYRQALRLDRNLPQAHYNLGKAQAAAGRIEEAVAAYREAVRLAPGFVEAQYNLGNALLRLQQAEAALACYDRVLALKSDHAEAWLNRGNALRQLQQIEPAAASFQRALASRPDSLEALNNLGKMLAALRRFEPAEAVLRQALGLVPQSVETLVNLAGCLRGAGKLEASAAASRAALAVAPGSADAQYNLALALVGLGRLEEALAGFGRTLELASDHQDALSLGLSVADTLCDWSAVAMLEARAEALRADGALGIDPFYCLNRPYGPREQLDCTRAFLARRGLKFRGAGFRYASPGPKLRIAYVSADFRAHPMSLLIGETIRRHDRDAFEVVGISYGPDDGSAARRAMAASFDRFIDVSAEGDAAIARQINALGIDIAVDLGGHTKHSRLGIFSSRPAPVQVAYLGYPGSCGADFIDYILADAFVLPADQQGWTSERIVHLPECYFANHALRPSGGPMPSRAECGLPETGFVFCSFNNTYKIKPDIFALWLRLLAAVPGSVLWQLADTAAVERNLRGAATAAAIDPARLVFALRAEQAAHLARHGLADLFLDTLPVNAHTTASDALWTGLPIVTCPGRTLIGRTAGSMLATLGVPELIAPDLVAYEALALALAGDPARLAALRRRVLEGRRTSPLFNAEHYARHIEAAYRIMIERSRAGLPPDGFAVPALPR
ncbi:MAG: tetratricopeptide repeat protein [Aliidongia sp.]